jgi:hypothetical protein
MPRNGLTSAIFGVERFGASTAVMLVHSFSKDRAGFEDYSNFVSRDVEELRKIFLELLMAEYQKQVIFFKPVKHISER